MNSTSSIVAHPFVSCKAAVSASGATSRHFALIIGLHALTQATLNAHGNMAAFGAIPSTITPTEAVTSAGNNTDPKDLAEGPSNVDDALLFDNEFFAQSAISRGVNAAADEFLAQVLEVGPCGLDPAKEAVWALKAVVKGVLLRRICLEGFLMIA